MRSSENWQSVGIGLIVIAISGWIAQLLFHEIRQAPWQFITIFSGVLGTLITLAINWRIQLRNEQAPKKTEIYDKVIKLFFNSILAEKLGQQKPDPEELTQSFAEIMPDLILWASDEVLNVYLEFRQMSPENSIKSTKSPILLFGKMLLAMRKDLGHQNLHLTESSILGTFVNDIENIS